MPLSAATRQNTSPSLKEGATITPNDDVGEVPDDNITDHPQWLRELRWWVFCLESCLAFKSKVYPNTDKLGGVCEMQHVAAYQSLPESVEGHDYLQHWCTLPYVPKSSWNGWKSSWTSLLIPKLQPDKISTYFMKLLFFHQGHEFHEGRGGRGVN